MVEKHRLVTEGHIGRISASYLLPLLSFKICTICDWDRSGIELQPLAAEVAYLEVPYIQHYDLAAPAL